ncbi:hypothetical protein QNM99_10260 [Pseudomonas sp. PCH446]
MTLSSMWKREKLKRDSFKAERQRCDRNWIFHKDRVVSVFEKFTNIDERFTFYPNETERNASWSSAQLFLSDFVVLSEFSRGSRCWAIHNNGTSKYREDERESGGSLTIHYTYDQALIQVFLKPPQSNKSFIEKADVLLWVGRNTDCLTVEFCERLIAKYLLFCRVESNYEKSSFWERRRVRWWRFMDARNRMQVLDTHVNFFTPWR